MEKRIIKAIIAERQQEISKIQLVERPISLLGMKKGQFQGQGTSAISSHPHRLNKFSIYLLL